MKRMIPLSLRCFCSALLFSLVLTGVSGLAAAQTVDGGAPLGRGTIDSGATTDGSAVGLPPVDAAKSWTEERVERLRKKIDSMKHAARDLGRLKASQFSPSRSVAGHFSCDLSEPTCAETVRETLARQLRQTTALLKEQIARQGLLEAQLVLPSQRLAKLQRTRRGRRRITLALTEEVAANRHRLELIRSETSLLKAKLAFHSAKYDYLKRSQPARLAAELERKKTKEAEATRAKQLAEEARLKAEKAREKAQAEQNAAEKAQREALETKSKAISETARLLASERARLEGIRGKQAKVRTTLVGSNDAKDGLREEMEKFRGGIVAREENLGAAWPQTAPAYDKLYDEVVAKWMLLQADASREILGALRGSVSVVKPGASLSPSVLGLDVAYRDDVKSLGALRLRLARAALELEGQARQARDDYLLLLQREVTWLNARRLDFFQRITATKRSGLTGITPQTLAQLLREVDNLVFDTLYWVNERRQQFTDIPGMVRNVFTVGSLLWILVKILLLLGLLRYLLRRWNRWLEVAFRRAQRSISLGENALRLSKQLDTLRHSGPALLVLIVAMLIYRLLGGHGSIAEVQVCYTVLFWIALYRFLLRVVENKADQAGLRKALLSATGTVVVEDESDGSHTGAEADNGNGNGGKRKRTKKLSEWHASGKVIPGPVLAVRSFRATSRYILAVVLALDLTRLAVGKGTFYQLTKEFSWWAAIPFLIYFLRLWRPHIIGAYQRLQKDSSARSLLTRLVRRSENSWYAVFVVAAAFVVVLANRVVSFIRNSLLNRDATKRMLAFLFRRSVAKHAEEQGRVVAKRQDLPQEILDQFQSDALTRRELPTSQPLMEEIAETFKVWQTDQTDGSLALVGRTGMGKSTTLGLLADELETGVLQGKVKVKITRPAVVISWLGDLFSPGAKISSEKELIRLINENENSVVALDDCHNFFLRQVDGFEGWSTFIRIVNETCDKIFWVLAFNQSAWDYLNNVAQRVHYFRRLIVMPSWTEDQIKALIMQRMRRARYGVSFSDLVVSQLHGAALSAQLGRTSAGYFRLLWDLTGGNPRLAGHFWLDSLVPVKNGRAVHVHLFQTPDVEDLDELPDDILFVLTAIAEHQNLTAKEAAAVTNLSLDFCRFAFKFCLEDGYMERGNNQLRYRLGRRWQVPIVRYLKRRHLLHG
jgi:hypothetical protein